MRYLFFGDINKKTVFGTSNSIRGDKEMETKFMGIKNVLFSILNNGEKESSDYAIAYYLLKHYKNIKKINIIDMAAECYVDRSTIRRFFRKNRLDNFQKFKQDYFDEFEERYYKDLPYMTYADYITDLNMKISVMMNEYTLKRDKSADIENVIDRIHQANNILLLGDESFYGNMYMIQHYLLSVGKIVFMITCDPDHNPVLHQLNKEDCILVLSLTGKFYQEIKKSIQGLPCMKIMLTLTAKDEWKDDFDYIGQLKRDDDHVDDDIYRKYAMTYYLDIMLNTYKMKYKGR